MFKLSKEEFETKKEQMRKKGDSVDNIRQYIFDTFENIINSYVNNIITINIKNNINNVNIYENIYFTYNKEEYNFCGKNICGNNKYFNIEKWEICDIIIDVNEYGKEIVLLLAEGDEIIIDIE